MAVSHTPPHPWIDVDDDWKLQSGLVNDDMECALAVIQREAELDPHEEDDDGGPQFFCIPERKLRFFFIFIFLLLVLDDIATTDMSIPRRSVSAADVNSFFVRAIKPRQHSESS